jgi:hypothetical protein
MQLIQQWFSTNNGGQTPFGLAWFEGLAMLALLVGSGLLRHPLRRWLLPLSSAFNRFARHTYLPYALVGGLSLGLSFLNAAFREPAPVIHDEFVYLMGADTFCSGRVTNPTHPLWPHFEAMHLLVKPSYSPKYPPGPSGVLALGQWLFGKPIVGVWLCLAAALMALLWMLRAMLPPQAALLGALIAAISGKVLKAWALGFFGGGLAFLGGALLFGALVRLQGRFRWVHSLTFGLGIVCLLNARPYEGGLTVLFGGFWLLYGCWQTYLSRRQIGMALRPLLLPALLSVACLGWIGYYNHRVTGQWSQLPYVLYGKQYEVARSFVFQPQNPEPPGIAHRPEMVAFVRHEAADQRVRQTPSGFVAGIGQKVAFFFRFYVGWTFLPLLLFFFFGKKNRLDWLAIGGVGLLIGANFVATFEHPHYIAPVTGLIIYALMRGGQHLQANRRIAPAAKVALWVAMLLTHLSQTALASVIYVTRTPVLGYSREWQARLRADAPARHVVLVKYGPTHHYDQEWVYNTANIDSQPIIWAHDLGDSANTYLMQYYRDRKIWRLRPDSDTTILNLEPLNAPARASAVGKTDLGTWLQRRNVVRSL